MITCYVPKPDFVQCDKEMNLGWFPINTHSVIDVTRWVSVKDELPKFNERGNSDIILFCTRDLVYCCGHADKRGDVITWHSVLSSYVGGVIAWMPIPELPEGIL